ncbi:hypothetical protein Naga_100950g1 [Nannochloropsis gaditana]|uniref:Uncharacterized protein n=1 Tax=Nannochloropsis gaditana TaxID=72520 RepID=W7TJT4_9STRA|nr:hypothetical protein Naga_100950g1 [Nannochloropsis gaditana]
METPSNLTICDDEYSCITIQCLVFLSLGYRFIFGGLSRLNGTSLSKSSLLARGGGTFRSSPSSRPFSGTLAMPLRIACNHAPRVSICWRIFVIDEETGLV